MSDTKLQRRSATHTPFASAVSKEVADLRNRMHRLFEEPLANLFGEPLTTEFFATRMAWYPALEVEEATGEFIVTAELPGMTKKDVQVDFEDGILTIRGEKEEKKEQKEGRKYHLYERSYGAFQRSLAFPFADPEKISAAFTDGILTIRLPKMTEAAARGRKIEIAEKK